MAILEIHIISVFEFITCRFPVYFRRKKLRQYRGVQTVEEIDMNGFVQSKPINVTELKQYCAQRHANSDFQFQQEFEVSTYPANIYLLNVNNRNTKKRREVCPELTIKTAEWGQWRRSGVVFIVNFKDISHFFLVFFFLPLNK